MISIEEFDAKFFELKLLAKTSWSNIEIAGRVADMYPFLPKNCQKVRRNYSSAVRTARNSGSVYLIVSKIDRLYRSARSAL